MDIILIAGLWLKASVWDEVVVELDRLGHRAIPVELPGVDDHDPSATLEDQVARVLATVDDADHPLVVGHSAACGLAWMAADRRPDAVAGVALVGGFPPHGGTYAEFFEISDGSMPFPGWGPFEGPDSDDLDADTKARIAADAVPVPAAVASGVVELSDERRYSVPITMVCPEYSPDDVRAWVEAGDIPELSKATTVAYVDIDSGHWPMVSRPRQLAELLAALATA